MLKYLISYYSKVLIKMSLDESINAYFVTSATSSTNVNENGVKVFASALSLLRNHIPENNIRLIKATDGFALISSGHLTKKDVFIFDRFEGDFFQQLQQTKSLIVGPPCIVSCLLKCEPIPLGISPVFATSMRELQISATGIPPQEKERLRTLIHWMGGHYFQNFGRSITHLISNTIKSTKYEHATLNGIQVMHVDWVKRVWERSLVDNITATDAEFEKYRLPIFYGTNITCTGLEADLKNKVMRIVNENGGTYHRAFRSQLVDVVITERNKTNSDKYQAALRYKKDILVPEWIFDSAKKGYALPTKTYQVKSLKVSTPKKGDQTIAEFAPSDQSQLTDLSRISIVRQGVDKSTINETICSNLNLSVPSSSVASFVAPAPPFVVQTKQTPAAITESSKSKDLTRAFLKKETSAGDHYRLAYEEICPRQAKKAGNFLDGCCIYLSGFRMQEKEKLNRILNAGGATRYDAPNEDVTHIIVGQLDDAKFKSWKNDGLLTALHIVRLEWLLQSIKLGQLANESVYRVSLPAVREPDAPSPSSKRTLRSMNHSFKQPEMPIKKKLFGSSNNVKNAPSKNDDPTVPVADSTNLSSKEDDDHQQLILQYSQEHEIGSGAPLPDATTVRSPIAISTQINEPIVTKATTATTQNSAETTNGGMNTIDFDKLNYFHGASVYIDKQHFADELYSQMLSECEAAQGNIVSRNFRDTVDYAIVSFERTYDVSQLPVRASYIVTELYVECCMKENSLVPIEYYHKHIPHTANSKPLADMIIVISIYSTIERDFIDSISQLLGARVNKTFIRKEKPLLVCPAAEGSKYEGAIKWGYPVVNSNWLVQCALHGSKLPYKNFLVGDSPQDFTCSPMLRDRNLTMTPVKTASGTSSNIPAAMDNNCRGYDSGGVDVENRGEESGGHCHDFTPLRNKRVSELAGPINRSGNHQASNITSADVGFSPIPQPVTPESPYTPTNHNNVRAAYNFDFMEGIIAKFQSEEARECIRGIVKDMRKNQTPELERIRRLACTPIVNKKAASPYTPNGVLDFCRTPEYQKRVADDLERRYRLPLKRIKPNTPVDEIRRRILLITCENLGISYDSISDDKVQHPNEGSVAGAEKAKPVGRKSHVIHNPGRSLFDLQTHTTTTPKTTRPSNTSNASDTFVANTQSSSDDPNGLDITSMGQRASLAGKSTINFDRISFEETNATNVTSDRRSTTATAATNATTSPEVKQITDYLKNCETRRQSLKRTCAGGSVGAGVSGRRSGQLSVSSGVPLPSTDAIDCEAHYVQPFESEQYCVDTEEMVGWRDPAEFNVERRSHLSSTTMHHKGKPRFSISCSDDQLRLDAITNIQELGGEICDNLVNYDPTCTHFVCERPNRAEKMLGCMSSGKWILSLKYIEECYAKDVFIDEELYEWGNPRALNMPQLTSDEQLIASAVYRWRTELEMERDDLGSKGCTEGGVGVGAFSGFRCLLRLSERNADSLKSVLQAGAGQVIEATIPYGAHNGAQLATHCFVDIKKSPLTKTDYEFLNASGVKILSQLFIYAYLMNGRNVDHAKYEICM